MSEEERAVEYRRKMTARSAWECAQRFTAHASNPVALSTLRANWLPWTDRDRGWDPSNDCREQGKGLQIP